MKSPLVDALRQASGSAAPSDHSEPAVEDEVAADTLEAGNEPNIADAGQLQLMASTGAFPVGDAGILPIDGAGARPVDGANDAAGDDVDAEFYETSSLQISEDDYGTEVTQPAHAAAYPPALQSGKRIGMSRFGYYSPLICLALAVAAIGCYLAYQKITGWYQNSDLASLSTQIEMSAEQNDARTTVPESGGSPFKLIIGPQVSSQSEVRAERDNTTAPLAQRPRTTNPATGIGSSDDNAIAALIDTYRSFEPGDLAAADESEIKHLINRHPDSAYLHFALGAHFAQKARWPSARVAFDQALRLDPANADYLFNLAVSLEHLGQYIDARYYYEAALQAVNTTSTLDSGVVVARIEKLTPQSDTEKPTR